MRSNIAFGTQSRKTLPFTVAGVIFFSHPLTVNEDLTFSDLADRYDLEALSTTDLVAFMMEQVEGLSVILRSRVQGNPEQPVDAAWVAQHLNTETFQAILGFLRSGQRSKKPVELRHWDEESFSVQDREFYPREVCFAEQAQAAALGTGDGTRAIVDASLDYLANLLTARALDGQPVLAEWLRDNLGSQDISAITQYLQGGQEAITDPNAEREENPEADAEADGSGTSAA